MLITRKQCDFATISKAASEANPSESRRRQFDGIICRLFHPFFHGDNYATLYYSFSTKKFEHVVGSWVTSNSVELVVSLTQDS